MLPYILSGIGVVIVLLLIVIAIQPAAFAITRSARFAATPAEVFGNVDDYHKWQAWSPWEKLDPNLKRDYDGPTSGVGAKYHWVGNNKVGEGRMTITEARPHERIAMKLEFIKPFVATNEALFTFAPVGEGTEMTWTMTGRRNFVMKGFGLLMNFDKMVGGQFAEGMENLKKIVETRNT